MQHGTKPHIITCKPHRHEAHSDGTRHEEPLMGRIYRESPHESKSLRVQADHLDGCINAEGEGARGSLPLGALQEMIQLVHILCLCVAVEQQCGVICCR